MILLGMQVGCYSMYVDIKTDRALSYGVYSIRMFNENYRLIYMQQYTVSVENSSPNVEYIQNGIPYLIYGKNLPEEGNYTADIMDVNNIKILKRGISLVKREGEN